jgi:hypothetical protein
MDYKKERKGKPSIRTDYCRNEQTNLQDLIKHYQQLENQANRRYNEVVERQLKRRKTIISDETQLLSGRIKELFGHDGLAIGALITATGMTFSIIILAFTPHNSPSTPRSCNNGVVKRVLVSFSNFLLDLAKKRTKCIAQFIKERGQLF